MFTPIHYFLPQMHTLVRKGHPKWWWINRFKQAMKVRGYSGWRRAVLIENKGSKAYIVGVWAGGFPIRPTRTAPFYLMASYYYDEFPSTSDPAFHSLVRRCAPAAESYQTMVRAMKAQMAKIERDKEYERAAKLDMAKHYKKKWGQQAADLLMMSPWTTKGTSLDGAR